MECPLYMNAVKFAEYTNRPVKEVRRLCRLQHIPCEYTRKVYLIDVRSALEILKERASDFEGHRYDFIATKRPVSARIHVQSSKKASTDKFLESLDALVRDK